MHSLQVDLLFVAAVVSALVVVVVVVVFDVSGCHPPPAEHLFMPFKLAAPKAVPTMPQSSPSINRRSIDSLCFWFQTLMLLHLSPRSRIAWRNETQPRRPLKL